MLKNYDIKFKTNTMKPNHQMTRNTIDHGMAVSAAYRNDSSFNMRRKGSKQSFGGKINNFTSCRATPAQQSVRKRGNGDNDNTHRSLSPLKEAIMLASMNASVQFSLNSVAVSEKTLDHDTPDSNH